MDDAPTFGAMLRAAREARGWSMADLARRLSAGTDIYTLVRMWERGGHQPTARSIARIAGVLGVSAEERSTWMRFIYTANFERPVWSDQRRASHFAAVSLRARGRCRLSDARLQLGLTVAELGRRLDVGPSTIVSLEKGSLHPRSTADYDDAELWREIPRRIAAYLGVTCAWLWPEHAPATPQLMREETPTPEALYADAEMRDVVRAAVAALPPRERAVIVRRFGLIDGEEATLEETAPHVGVSRERVRQLEAVALRELRAKLRNTAAREP